MEFIQAFSLQRKVISALILREVTSRYANTKLGFFWALFEPFAHIAVFMSIFTVINRPPPVGESIGLFILTGIVPWLLYNKTVSTVMSAVAGNKALLGYPQVMPLDIVIARVLLEFATMFMVMLIFLGVALFFGFTIKVDNFLDMLIVCGLIILFAMGVGFINTTIIDFFPSYKSIYSALSMPLYFGSGIFFTMDFFSNDVLGFLAYNPILNLIEWFRDAFFTEFSSNLFDREYAITVAFVVFGLGLLLERLMRKRARQIGR